MCKRDNILIFINLFNDFIGFYYVFSLISYLISERCRTQAVIGKAQLYLPELLKSTYENMKVPFV